MPRSYDMTKRRAAVEETKRRIVEATMDLHNRQGVLATSWEQIAERAGVAPATVYRHFPSLDELLPACGALSFEALELPDVDEFASRLEPVERSEARLRELVRELFSLYDRGHETIWAIRRDRAILEPLQEAHEEIEARIGALHSVALGPLALDDERQAAVRALTDYDTWRALGERGIAGESAIALTVELLAGWLGIVAGRR